MDSQSFTYLPSLDKDIEKLTHNLAEVTESKEENSGFSFCGPWCLWKLLETKDLPNKRNIFFPPFTSASTILSIHTSLQAAHIQEVLMTFQVWVIILLRIPREIHIKGVT